jgi:hypothetical protein
LTTGLTGLDWSVLQIKAKNVSCHIADSYPVKQEVNGTVIHSPLVFPGYSHFFSIALSAVSAECIMLSIFLVSVVNAECRYAECRGAKFRIYKTIDPIKI